jgi:hypothetical protein
MTHAILEELKKKREWVEFEVRLALAEGQAEVEH